MCAACICLGNNRGEIVDKGIPYYHYRIAVLVAILSFTAVVMLPETLASKIVRTQAAKMNKAAGCKKFVAATDLNRKSFWSSLVC